MPLLKVLAGYRFSWGGTLMQFDRVHSRTCTLCHAEDTCAVDHHSGALICTGCGNVVDEHYDWPENSYKAPSAAQYYRNQRRTYIPYNRSYHLNERIAQRNAVCPRVPRKIILELSEYFERNGVAAQDLDSHKICKELRRRGYKKYCERWTQIKFRLCCEDISEREVWEDEALLHIKPANRRDTDFPQFWPHKFLDDDAIFAFRFYFALVSQAFDERYFKAGKRHTVKCLQYNNPHISDSRHNLLHYNFLFRQFHLLYGGQEFADEYESAFFFPLLRTDSVLKTLNRMWKEICVQWGWPFYSLSTDASES